MSWWLPLMAKKGCRWAGKERDLACDNVNPVAESLIRQRRVSLAWAYGPLLRGAVEKNRDNLKQVKSMFLRGDDLEGVFFSSQLVTDIPTDVQSWPSLYAWSSTDTLRLAPVRIWDFKNQNILYCDFYSQTWGRIGKHGDWVNNDPRDRKCWFIFSKLSHLM